MGQGKVASMNKSKMKNHLVLFMKWEASIIAKYLSLEKFRRGGIRYINNILFLQK